MNALYKTNENATRWAATTAQPKASVQKGKAKLSQPSKHAESKARRSKKTK